MIQILWAEDTHPLQWGITVGEHYDSRAAHHPLHLNNMGLPSMEEGGDLLLIRWG